MRPGDAGRRRVEFVLTGTLANGSQPLFDTLAGQKPVIIGNPLTTPDFVAKDAFAFTPGAPGVMRGMAQFVSTQLPGASRPRPPWCTRTTRADRRASTS